MLFRRTASALALQNNGGGAQAQKGPPKVGRKKGQTLPIIRPSMVDLFVARKKSGFECRFQGEPVSYPLLEPKYNQTFSLEEYYSAKNALKQNSIECLPTDFLEKLNLAIQSLDGIAHIAMLKIIIEAFETTPAHDFLVLNPGGDISTVKCFKLPAVVNVNTTQNLLEC